MAENPEEVADETKAEVSQPEEGKTEESPADKA